MDWIEGQWDLEPYPGPETTIDPESDEQIGYTRGGGDPVYKGDDGKCYFKPINSDDYKRIAKKYVRVDKPRLRSVEEMGRESERILHRPRDPKDFRPIFEPAGPDDEITPMPC